MSFNAEHLSPPKKKQFVYLLIINFDHLSSSFAASKRPCCKPSCKKQSNKLFRLCRPRILCSYQKKTSFQINEWLSDVHDVLQARRAALALPAVRRHGQTRDPGPLACAPAAPQRSHQEQQRQRPTGSVFRSVFRVVCLFVLFFFLNFC